MWKIKVLCLIVMVVCGCTNKVNVKQYQDAAVDIQEYANQNINPNWFTSLEPIVKIVVTNVEIKKAKVSKEDNRSVELAVLLNGYFEPVKHTDRFENKHFKLTKSFIVTKVNNQGKTRYRVELPETKN